VIAMLVFGAKALWTAWRAETPTAKEIGDELPDLRPHAA
jgi:hypothetical protein